ncbi:MAG TPA: hypothetical protein VM101_11450 [Flavitalea sp.]|nr:hypothetical protein [Flavitalea sp.]
MNTASIRTWYDSILKKLWQDHFPEEKTLLPHRHLNDDKAGEFKSTNRIVKIKGKMIYVHSTLSASNMQSTKKTPNDFKRRNTEPQRNEITDKLNDTVSLLLIPRKFAVIFTRIALILFFFSLSGTVLKYIFLRNDFFTNSIVYFFDSSLEGNIPTFFSSLILFIAGALCYLIYNTKSSLKNKYMRSCWLMLSMIFMFLTIDESSRIHEQFSKLHLPSDRSGFLRHSWIIPYSVFAIIAGLYFFKFVKSLPARTKIIFLVSGFIYVGAALGFEPLEGHLTLIYKGNNLYDKLLCSIEEMLEMCGMILFIYGLMDYSSRMNINLKFTVPIQKI